MKRIDMNMSLGGRDHMGRTVDLSYLLDLMDDYRITRSVCYHRHALLDPKEGNAEMARLAAESRGRIRVCAVLDPILGAENLPGTGTLQARLTAFAPDCLRVFPAAARVPFHPFYWEEILEAADALRLPLIVDDSYTDAFFCGIPAVSASYPNAKFILLREGCCQSRRIFPLLQKRENVYFTIERMLDYGQLEEIQEKYGCRRLLFGSGFPERPHAGALGLLLYADITEENRERISCKNWEEITK